MSSAACAGICSWKAHNTNPSGKLFLASVIQIFKFLLCRIKNLNFLVFPDNLIHFRFDFGHLFFIQHSVEIDGDHIASHVESHIVISKCFVYQPTYNMLSGMLLHKIKSSAPVNFSYYIHTDFQRPICIMN